MVVNDFGDFLCIIGVCGVFVGMFVCVCALLGGYWKEEKGQR